MARGHVNLHRGLREGELPRRYLRLRDEDIGDDGHDPDPGESFTLNCDDYWNPWNETTARDFNLERTWADLASDLIGARIPLPAATAAPAAPRVRDDLVAAFHSHLQRLVDADQHGLARDELAAPRRDLRDASVRVPALSGWISRHRGPSLMLLLLAPFWLRPLAAWTPPSTDDDALGRSLVDHVLVAYPVPPALYVPWADVAVPSLKWASWLVLLGGGASLRRAAPMFGWKISSRLVHHLLQSPPRLQPLEAMVWAELAQRGGTMCEFARMRRHPSFLVDLTSTPDASTDDNERQRAERFRAFWYATADWLVRHRDELTDDECERVLDWAMHRFTEDDGQQRAPNQCFTLTGRAPVAAHEQALAYREALRVPYGYEWPQSWARRSWDWELGEGEHTWTVHELATSAQLADESAAMRHCVASYAYRCVSGASAIFSLQRDGQRVITIELEPGSRRVVQARGPYNRACTADELALVERWLANTAPRDTESAG